MSLAGMSAATLRAMADDLERQQGGSTGTPYGAPPPPVPAPITAAELSVMVPAGVVPGQILLVDWPGVQTLKVACPQDAAPGVHISVQIPPNQLPQPGQPPPMIMGAPGLAGPSPMGWEPQPPVAAPFGGSAIVPSIPGMPPFGVKGGGKGGEKGWLVTAPPGGQDPVSIVENFIMSNGLAEKCRVALNDIGQDAAVKIATQVGVITAGKNNDAIVLSIVKKHRSTMGWKCASCQFRNAGRNTHCGGEKGTVGCKKAWTPDAEPCQEPGRYKPSANDWQCPKCNFSNFAERHECKQCGFKWEQGGAPMT